MGAETMLAVEDREALLFEMESGEAWVCSLPRHSSKTVDQLSTNQRPMGVKAISSDPAA